MAKQTSKEEQHINVYVRIRPNNAMENENKLSVLEVLSKREILSKNSYTQKRYVFDRVFGAHSSQQEIYNSIVAPLIPEVIGGYNCTVFAYGQTGTGKTYTMEGIHDRDNQINAGIIPRSLAQIFKVLSSMNTESSVKVSYLELYNEELFDLLTQCNTPKAIRIFEDKSQKGSVILQGLEELSVTELNQVSKILEQGSERRRIASTLINSSSSRSHTVFTIVVHTREITIDGEELVKTGKLNLVDLAGSENISKSGAIDKRAREAGSINQSLLTLGRVIKALTEKNTHVPYRESKLTRILQDSLGGRTKTSLIATISSANVHIEETLNTLEYSMRARCIQNRPELNQKISRTALINQYSDTIERLQRDLIAMRTGCGVFVDEDNYTKLVSDHEAQKVEITEKMGYIKKLETEICDSTDKLHTLQTSWIEAANNIEQLANEKKILEKDLILVKEVNEQQIRELQDFRSRYKYLKGETETLLHDIQKHSSNEDTLHRKVSYLYQTSQSNRIITNAFYNTYNKIYMKLMSHIEKCITCVLQSTLDIEILFKDESREITYSNIMSELNELLKFSSNLREYKLKYFQNKKVMSTRFSEYFNSLQKLTDCMHERAMKFSEQLDGSLLYIRDTIDNFSSNHGTDLKAIIPNLFNIRETTAAEFNMMSEILKEFHNTLINNMDDMLNEIEMLKEENDQSHGIIVTLHEKLNGRYNSLLSDISDMKEMCATNFSNYDSRQRNIIGHCSNLSKKMKCLQETVKTDTTVIYNKTYSTLDTLENLVDTSVTSVNAIGDNIQLKKEKIVESIDARINDCTNTKSDINRCLGDYETRFSNCYSEASNLENTDDDHYNILSEMVNGVYDATKNIEVNCRLMANQQIELKNKIDDTVEETTLVLKDTEVTCNYHSHHLKTLLDEFCGCKLQYPTHAGDTPQKVQPRSSLYITTLSKSCFNVNDDLKSICNNELVDKENTSATLNVIHAKGNGKGT